ncbi:MAG TPA: molecular chaperone TorD family protein, partial [Anaerolineae bacterium]|nr:molecular chaperone TorD family protein [Anaerolineae bacterium]
KGLSILHESLPDDAIGKTSKELLDFLGEKDANETVRAEFIRLFWEPDGPVVSLLASHYVDGKPFGKYLVRMRTFLEKTPFRKSDDYTEPEDSLPFHLDLMRSFIGEEKKTSYPEKKAHWHNLQHELLNDYIHMWIDEFLSDLVQRDTEPFYRKVALLMRLYFQEEREMILEE